MKKQSFHCSSFLGNCNVNISFNDIFELDLKNNDELIQILYSDYNFKIKVYVLKVLVNRLGEEYEIFYDEKNLSFLEIAQYYYEYATSIHDWSSIRKLAEIMKIYDERLEDALLEIVIRQKRLAVGRAYSENATFSKPQECSLIIKTINEYCGKNDAENVLTQEIMMHLGHLLRTDANLFENIITIRTWHFVQLLVSKIKKEKNLEIAASYELLLSLAPHDIYEALKEVLSSYTKKSKQMIKHENLYASGELNKNEINNTDEEFEEYNEKNIENWAIWRKETGLIARLASSFYKNIWYLLHQCTGLVIGDKYNISSRISSEFTLETTAGERNFELRVDSLIQSIEASDYKKLNIEVLQSISKFFKNNPDIKVDNDLVLDVIIGHAVRISWKENHDMNNYDEQKAQAWSAFYNLAPNKTEEFFIKALMSLLKIQ